MSNKQKEKLYQLEENTIFKNRKQFLRYIGVNENLKKDSLKGMLDEISFYADFEKIENTQKIRIIKLKEENRNRQREGKYKGNNNKFLANTSEILLNHLYTHDNEASEKFDEVPGKYHFDFTTGRKKLINILGFVNANYFDDYYSLHKEYATQEAYDNVKDTVYNLTYGYVRSLLNSLENKDMITFSEGYIYIENYDDKQYFLYDYDIEEQYNEVLEAYFNQIKDKCNVTEPNDILKINNHRIQFYKRLYSRIKTENDYSYIFQGYNIKLSESGYNSVTGNVLSKDDYEKKRKEVNTLFIETLNRTLENNLIKKYKHYKIGKKAEENRLKREQLQKEYTLLEKKLILI